MRFQRMGGYIILVSPDLPEQCFPRDNLPSGIQKALQQVQLLFGKRNRRAAPGRAQQAFG
jgi:hypothetical protein